MNVLSVADLVFAVVGRVCAQLNVLILPIIAFAVLGALVGVVLYVCHIK